LRASGEWTRNLNDLELIGNDTRERVFGAGADYSSHGVSLLYDFGDRLTRNVTTRIDRISRTHLGRFDFSRGAFKQALTLETSYQLVSREERDRDRRSGETLIVLAQSAGLYADDQAPEFDALNSAPGLIDGILTTPASTDFNLSGSSYHNFGLDFGAPVSIDHVFLYTDTLANPDLRWSIWTSTDNLTWTQIRGRESAPFTPVFNRYEFAFAKVETRYIKLALEPALAVLPVYVTELRGLIARGSGDVPERSTDQRGSAQLRFRPRKGLDFGIGGHLSHLSTTQTSFGRDEDGVLGNLRYAPGTKFETVGRYQRTRTHFAESTREAVTTEQSNLLVRWTLNAAATALASVDRHADSRENLLVRRSDGARTELRTVVFPALKSTSQVSYSEDHRFDVNDIYYTRTYGQSFDGEPTPRSTISVDYRYYDLSARYRVVPSYRETLALRGTYRMTDALTFSSEGSRSREPGHNGRNMNASLNWTATPKLNLGGTVNRIEGRSELTSTQWSLQGYFRWTTHTDLSFGYSIIQQQSAAEVNTARIGLNSRF
jgi:hypothetical protein